MAHTRAVTGSSLLPRVFLQDFYSARDTSPPWRSFKIQLAKSHVVVTFFFVNHLKKKDAWTQNMKKLLFHRILKLQKTRSS